jgi:hypothetical protein
MPEPPSAALDCDPATIPNFSITTPTPGDSASVPDQVLKAQQGIESAAFNAFQNPGLSMQTYFVVLDNDRHDPSAYNFFSQVQTDLVQPSGAQPVITLDARDVSTNASGAGAAKAVSELGTFTQILSKLGTCLYEIPQTEGITSSSPLSSVQIQYTKPVPPGTVLPPGANAPVRVPADPNCNQAASLSDAGIANGWSFDGNRIRICGAACDGIRTQVQNAAAIGVATGTYPDVPVTITPLCSAGGPSDATSAGD